MHLRQIQPVPNSWQMTKRHRSKYEKNPSKYGFDISVTVAVSSCGDEGMF
jgi:hypothetical protein